MEAFRRATAGLDVQWSEPEPAVFCAAFDPERVGVAELLQRVLAAAAVKDVAIEDVGIEQVVREIYEGTRTIPVDPAGDEALESRADAEFRGRRGA